MHKNLFFFFVFGVGFVLNECQINLLSFILFYCELNEEKTIYKPLKLKKVALLQKRKKEYLKNL